MRVVALGDICQVTTGQSAPQEASAFGSTGIPFVRAGSLERLCGGESEESLELVPAEQAFKYRLKTFPRDTVVFAKSGMSAKVGRVYRLRRDCHVVSHLAAVLPSNEIDPGYLHRWFEYSPPSRLIENDAYPSIKTSTLERIAIPLPALPEQRRIAAILDKADALRAKRREAIAKLDQLLLSVFIDTFGDPEANSNRWPEFLLGEIASSAKIGLVRSSEEFGENFSVPYVRMDAVSANGKFLSEKVQKTDVDEGELHEYGLEHGDLLFNTRNSKELVGKTCVYSGPRGWVFNNNLMRIRFRDGISPSVIAIQFQFSRVKRELEKRKSGTTNVFAVYWRELRTLPLLVPPIEKQKRFASIAAEIEAQMRLMQDSATQLNSLFTSIQHRIFAGVG